MPVMEAIAIGSILANVFGNLFGAHKQAKTAEKTTKAQIEANNRAAELEKQAIDEALAYTKEIDARDYNDWLQRDVRDRKDWEAREQRRAPYRALGDSAIRTLADYITVPGMQPAQEVPVQQWTPQQPVTGFNDLGNRLAQQAGVSPKSGTMPVSNPRDLTNVQLSQQPNGPNDFRAFLPGYQIEGDSVDTSAAGWRNTAPQDTLLSRYGKRIVSRPIGV